MAQPVNRESLIALRATRQAHRVAGDVLHRSLRPIDIRIRCGSCNGLVDPTTADINMIVDCPHCAATIRVPEDAARELGSVMPAPKDLSIRELEARQLEQTGLNMKNLIAIVMFFFFPLLVLFCIIRAYK